MIRALTRRLLQGRYFSQNHLDRKLETYVNGYFVELGANDGVPQSTSLYIDKHRYWLGLLVEPAPQNFLKCRQSRFVAQLLRQDRLLASVEKVHANRGA